MPAAAAHTVEPFDELTLRRAQRGDEPAWRALIERYQAAVHPVIWRMLAGRALHRVEDLAQETVLRVLRALPAFDPGGTASPSTWILTIATRLALHELRRPEHAALVDEPRARAAIAPTSAATSRSRAPGTASSTTRCSTPRCVAWPTT